MALNRLARSPRRLWLKVLVSLLTVVAVIGGATLWYQRGHMTELAMRAIVPARAQSFPAIDTAKLTPTQQRIVALLKQEFTAQHPGSYYAEGANEAWCADFASWIMKNAGQPFTNPNSGSWRIPGVYTLQDYFQSEHRFVVAGSAYTPKVGDVVIYHDPSPFGTHTNIIIANDGGKLTTVGGNEPGGIRVKTYNPADDPGLVGYGKL
jgi:hypothetical protein